MEKQISVWSYWLGLLSTAASVILRGLASMGIIPNLRGTTGVAISYNTFLNGAALLFLISIASSLLIAWRAKS